MTDALASVEDADPTQCFVVYGLAADSESPVNLQVTGAIEGRRSLRFRRIGSDGPVDIRWSLVCLAETAVQSGAFPTGNGGGQTTLNPVELATTFPLVDILRDGFEFDANDSARSFFADRQTLAVEINDVDDEAIASFQVVSMSGSTVVSGDAAMEAAETKAIVDHGVADLDRAFLLFSYTLEEGQLDDIRNKLVNGVIDGDVLRFERAGDGVRISLTWHLVALPIGFAVQRGIASFAQGELTRSVRIESVSSDRTFAMSGSRGGMTAGTDGDTPGNAWVTLELATDSELLISRASATSSADVGWFVIESPP